jgi:NADP-dependent 3-hydroxy acid dehydrogenase YdfG
MTTPQNVLITGTSSGFGRLTAQTLARKGHVVFASMRGVNGKNAAAARELGAWAEQEKVKLHVVALDVTDDASVDAAVRTIVEGYDRIDVVVNNAGRSVFGLQETVTVEQARDIFETNVFGVLRVDRAVLPQLRKQGSGLIVHISSGLGRVVIPALSIYGASKFAIESIAEGYHMGSRRSASSRSSSSRARSPPSSTRTASSAPTPGAPPGTAPSPTSRRRWAP